MFYGLFYGPKKWYTLGNSGFSRRVGSTLGLKHLGVGMLVNNCGKTVLFLQSMLVTVNGIQTLRSAVVAPWVRAEVPEFQVNYTWFMFYQYRIRVAHVYCWFFRFSNAAILSRTDRTISGLMVW
jgi:hypothetical protein